MGTAATITELTDCGGFRYKIDNPYWIKLSESNSIEVSNGEVFDKGLLEWKIVNPIQNKIIYHQDHIYTGSKPC